MARSCRQSPFLCRQAIVDEMRLMGGISEPEVTTLLSAEVEDGLLAKSVNRWIVMEDCWRFEWLILEAEIERK